MPKRIPRPIYRSPALYRSERGRRSCRLAIGPLEQNGPSVAYRLDELDDKIWITPLSYGSDLLENPEVILEDFNAGVMEAIDQGFLLLDGSSPELLRDPPESRPGLFQEVAVAELIGKH
jgi:hypothetical protein